MPAALPLLLAAAAGVTALALSSKKTAAAPAAGGGAATSGTYTLDTNLPPQLEKQVLGAISGLKDPAALQGFAKEMESAGYPLAGEALLQRAAELGGAPSGGTVVGPAQPSGPTPQPAPNGVTPQPPMPSALEGALSDAQGLLAHIASTGPAGLAASIPRIQSLIAQLQMLGDTSGMIAQLQALLAQPAGPPVPGGPGTTTPTTPGLPTLDPGMDQLTASTVQAMLAQETDPAKLQGMAGAIQAKYPIASGLLWAKAASIIAQQTPPAQPATPAIGPAPLTPSTPPTTPTTPTAPLVVAPVTPATPAAPATPTAPPPAGTTWRLATDADVARDGVASRIMALLPMPVGTEVQEQHNGRTWKIRVISSATDPSLTKYAKDVKGWIASVIQGVVPGPTPAAPSAPPAAPQLSGPGIVATNADVQQALNALGYSPALAVDGIIGPKSQAGVRWFQGNNGLTVDGIPGPKTKAALVAALAGSPIPASSLAQPAAVVPPVYTPPAPAPLIAPAPPMAVNTNTDVQKAINALGYSPPLVVDGAIGPKSIAAVKWFQQNHGLTVDGVPGPITKAALQAALVAQGIAPMGVSS
jgi:peptidoglycan hydrolase-like protein with peptidoglycan-binding domain